MKSLVSLEEQALQRRLQFNRTLREVERRTTLHKLADDAFASLDVRPDKSLITVIGIASAVLFFRRLFFRTEQAAQPKSKNRKLKQERSHESQPKYRLKRKINLTKAP